ncbi:AarF/ABC1/UbiB kinase family protein [Hahella sp. SMD15-11]|uniref:AarF/ABC1/UbiB kinase family protein n=1 Tax=Thermohahella caldifontis TaxID=3142973 RepID=A0AB39UUL5_9GAMM
MNWPTALGDAAKGLFRIGQTGAVVARQGIRWLQGDRPPAPRLLRETFEALGSTYIKLGQFIASSPTFFPPEYVEEFQKCLDQTPPLPFHVIRQILLEDLGRPLDEVYAWIDTTPLASASIAQVHAARLVTGEDVVIKVQKPGVRTVLLTDLNMLWLMARVLEKLAPKLSWASLSDIVEEIQQTMMEECDFYQEARNLKTFREFLDRQGITEATVPKVYEQASTLRVLTMERFYGVPLTDLNSIRKVCKDPERTLITAMNTWFASLTQCDFFHADVHAGNLMVLEDGRVGFIDFGIVGRIPKGAWESMSDFITAVSMGDAHGMARAMVGIGVTKRQVDVDKLAADIRGIYSKLDEMVPDTAILYDARETEDDINSLIMDLIRLGEQHGLHFPREFALLLKQFLYFDRYVHILAPEMDMFMDERLMRLQ